MCDIDRELGGEPEVDDAAYLQSRSREAERLAAAGGVAVPQTSGPMSGAVVIRIGRATWYR